jgi:PAS domain S-box-containing protein
VASNSGKSPVRQRTAAKKPVARRAGDVRRAAERYRNLVEQAVDGIFIADDEGIYVEVNASGARLLGLPRARIIGRHVADFICEEDRAQLAADWAMLRRGKAVTRERLFRRSNGTVFHGEVSAKRLPDGLYQGILRDVSVRKFTETALRHSEERFRNLTASAFEGICIHNHGRIVDVNDQFARMCGYARAELIGRDALSLVAPESLPGMLRVIQEAADEPREHFILRKDGTKLAVESRAKTALWGVRPVRVVAVRDLSAHKAAEAARRESEAKFTKVFRVSPVPILITDFRTAEIVDANDAFGRTFEGDREQMIGRTTLQLNLWVDRRERAELLSRLSRSSTVHDFKGRGRTMKGRVISVRIHCELIELADRLCILMMVQDVTEQERADAALRESEEKFAKAFRSGPDAMAIAEFDSGRYLEINEGFERLFGYPRAEVIGHTSLELGIWKSGAERAAFLAELTAHGAVREIEIQGRNRRGEPLVYLLSAECMTLGGRKCIVSASHDITDRKRAIESEREAREAFTRRLIATQEAERRRIAGELHDSLGQNLLLVKNRAQLALQGDTVPPDLRWQFESIHDLAAQAIAEVRQISHDLRPYQLDQLGLTRALEGMIDGVRRNTGFSFTRRLDPIDDLFPGESATHLFRIVQECLNNVLKHARAKAAEVLIERDVHHVRLWIEDDGCGFAADLPATGAGFGLRNIAERARILGGTWKVDSSAGRGTRVEVVLPIAADGR